MALHINLSNSFQGLRAIPNLNVFRPADINEALECWEIAVKNKNTPSVIALSRQKVAYVNRNNSIEKNVKKALILSTLLLMKIK